MLFRFRKTYQSLSDAELVKMYKDKSSSAIIGELYTRYGHLVMGTSMKYLKNKANAEDLSLIHISEPTRPY